MTQTPTQRLQELARLLSESGDQDAVQKARDLLAVYTKTDPVAGKKKPTKDVFKDRWLRARKPAPAGTRQIFYDLAMPNFAFIVTDKSTPHAIGSFYLCTRFPGDKNPVKRKIGDYPAMPLATAREIAREWLQDIKAGIDPKAKAADRLAEEAARRADTFAAVFAEFADEHLSTLASGKEIRAAFKRRVFPVWQNKPITDITHSDIYSLLRAVKKDAPILANRLHSYLSTFFKWARKAGKITTFPMHAIDKLTKEQSRDRALTDTEIRLVWRACDDFGPFGRAIKLMLLSGQRRNEVSELPWREIDRKQKTWTIPRERTKTDKAHEIPLSDLALSIIGDQPKDAKGKAIGTFVFTTSDDAAKGVAISGWSKVKRKLDAAVAKLAEQESEETGEPVTVGAWHLHDLRRSCATNLAKLHIEREVLKKILNHATSGKKDVTDVYDRYNRETETRAALNAWADRLAQIVSGTDDDGGNVVKLPVRGGK